ncbi:hypothetical protein OEZ85_012407 [Tetradesmus obliquus]|uniref:Nodulin-like domain-containing protein n=1 Tax=Tetradesmus obliquus TaxID=3088 RepID=A0ABY8TTM6_TETOB|nr:hypothetical protein OEZ85_012407 [Tetradesmus obliquus]
MAAGFQQVSAMPTPIIAGQPKEILNINQELFDQSVVECGGHEEEPELKAVLSKVSRWLLPICFLAGVFSYLESTNLNFAALQLNAGLGFAPQDYGLGAGLFFLGAASPSWR